MAFRSSRFTASLRSAAPAALTLALGSLGCDAILGIHDVERDPASGSAGSAGSGTAGSAGNTGGNAGSGGSTMSGGSAGAAMSGDFDFAAGKPLADLPLAGESFLGVQIARGAGFTGEVKVEIKLPPSDVTFQGTTLPSDTTTGKVLLGAKASAKIGQMFDLTLVATSGALSHEVTLKGVVTGTPGTLVEAFGVAGVASWLGAMDGTSVLDVRQVAEGKIVFTGDSIPALASTMKGGRILPDGTMDPGFGGGDGLVSVQLSAGTRPSQGRTVLRELGGRVLMIGFGDAGAGLNDDVGIARFKDDGTADNVGGDEGETLIDINGGLEETGGAAFAKDGRVVVAGSTNGMFMILKVNDFYNGVENSFAGGAGFLQFPAGVMSAPRDIAVDATTGDIVGLGRTPAMGLDTLVVRLTGAGVPAAFGDAMAGSLIMMRPGDQNPKSVAIDSQGRIVVAGGTDENGNVDIYVARFLADGQLDTKFGDNGVAVLALAGNQEVEDMSLLDDDRIVVGGNANQTPFLARFLTDGTPDPTFGMTGFVQIALGAQADVDSMSTTNDGRILLAGSRESQPSKGFVAKIWQ